MKVRRPHSPVEAGRNTEGFMECSGESLERAVVRIESNLRYGIAFAAQLPGGSLQQKPPAHGARAFLKQCLEQTVELRPALVGSPGQVPRPAFYIQRARDERPHPPSLAFALHVLLE